MLFLPQGVEYIEISTSPLARIGGFGAGFGVGVGWLGITSSHTGPLTPVFSRMSFLCMKCYILVHYLCRMQSSGGELYDGSVCFTEKGLVSPH